jgi:hypothetical protein
LPVGVAKYLERSLFLKVLQVPFAAIYLLTYRGLSAKVLM